MAAATTIARTMTTTRSPRRCGARGRSGAGTRGWRRRRPRDRRAHAAAAGAATPPAPFVVEQTGDTIAGRAARRRRSSCCASCAPARTPSTRGWMCTGAARAEALRALEQLRRRGARARRPRLLVIHGRGHGSDAGGPVLRPADLGVAGERRPPHAAASWRSSRRGRATAAPARRWSCCAGQVDDERGARAGTAPAAAGAP